MSVKMGTSTAIHDSFEVKQLGGFAFNASGYNTWSLFELFYNFIWLGKKEMRQSLYHAAYRNDNEKCHYIQ